MGIFDRIFGRGKQPAPKAKPPRAAELQERAINERREQEIHEREREANRESRKWFLKEFTSRQRRSPHLMHTDGGFDEDELAALLLGLKVPCRSSWIQSARWNEEASQLTLTIKGKEYDFPGIDYDGAVEFARAFSKGSEWFWRVWKGKYGMNQSMGIEWGEQTGRARRIT